MAEIIARHKEFCEENELSFLEFYIPKMINRLFMIRAEETLSSHVRTYRVFEPTNWNEVAIMITTTFIEECRSRINLVREAIQYVKESLKKE